MQFPFLFPLLVCPVIQSYKVLVLRPMKDTNLSSLVSLPLPPSPFLPCFSFFRLAGGYITELGTLLSLSVCALVLQGGTCRDGRQAGSRRFMDWRAPWGLPDEGCLLEDASNQGSPLSAGPAPLYASLQVTTVILIHTLQHRQGTETENEVVPGSSEPADRTRCSFQNPRV